MELTQTGYNAHLDAQEYLASNLQALNNFKGPKFSKWAVFEVRTKLGGLEKSSLNIGCNDITKRFLKSPEGIKLAQSGKPVTITLNKKHSSNKFYLTSIRNN